MIIGVRQTASDSIVRKRAARERGLSMHVRQLPDRALSLTLAFQLVNLCFGRLRSEERVPRLGSRV
jgi:hypothetical protein